MERARAGTNAGGHYYALNLIGDGYKTQGT